MPTKDIILNQETNYPLASQPEELPPLREGYIRLVHQTNKNNIDSIAENGLIYNKKAAGKEHLSLSNYPDVTSISYAFTEDEFWNSLTQEHEWHRATDTKVIFDMPAEEYWAHTQEQWFDLGGAISRGYLVGAIPNYGNKNLKLSISEMEHKKALSLHNPLPPFYETPKWKEKVEFAHAKRIEEIQEGIDTAFTPEDFDNAISSLIDNTDNHFVDIDDFESKREITEKDRKKREQRENAALKHNDMLQEKLKKMRKYLDGYQNKMGKTGDSSTGEINAFHESIAQNQTEIAKEIMLRNRKQRT